MCELLIISSLTITYPLTYLSVYCHLLFSWLEALIHCYLYLSFIDVKIFKINNYLESSQDGSSTTQ